MREKQEGRGPLWKRVRDRYDRVTGRCLRGELQGCRQLVLQGCEKILEYGNCRIRLSLRDPDACEIVVCGRELVCLTYHPDAVVVQGMIHYISFCCDGAEWGEDVCGSTM
ncbi:MAG: YabP/YqfC family sporulation protein [Clostridia bacterium]|nr:YabP/YqfC family sporulation protein [Clostridia bacterium]